MKTPAVLPSAPPVPFGASDSLAAAPRRSVRFGYFNPDAAEVFIAGTFNAWEPGTLPLERDATGNWCVNLPLPPGEYHYRLIVDGEWRDHPGAARLVPCPFGGNNAVVTV